MGVAGKPTRDLRTRQDGGRQRAGEVLTTLGPVQTVPQQRSPRLGDLHTQLGKDNTTVLGNRETVGVVDEFALQHPVPKPDPEPPGKMVITGPGLREPPSPNAGFKPTRRFRLGVVGKPLNELGDVGILKTNVAVAALLERPHKPGVGKHANMLTGSRRRDTGDFGKLPDGPGPPVDERKTHSGPTVIGQNGGHLRELHTSDARQPTCRRRPKLPFGSVTAW